MSPGVWRTISHKRRRIRCLNARKWVLLCKIKFYKKKCVLPIVVSANFHHEITYNRFFTRYEEHKIFTQKRITCTYNVFIFSDLCGRFFFFLNIFCTIVFVFCNTVIDCRFFFFLWSNYTCLIYSRTRVPT